MKNIVTIGGGTGSFTTLSGLKKLPDISISALVSMADDGGSTGVLRDELGVLPPGDVRQCLVALSAHTDTVRNLMNYRFSEGTLSGHSFGNIFLAALEKVTGSFAEGVEVASEILKIEGRVIPITNNKAELAVELKDGQIFYGENEVQDAPLQSVGLERIFYTSDVAINKHAYAALINADYIILGPGNYYCSLLPNLIVEGFEEAIRKTKAKIIFPVNLTNKMEHTGGWKVSDYVSDLEKRIGRKIDFVLVNSQKPSDEQIEYYKKEEGQGVWVENDFKDSRIVLAELLSPALHKPQLDEELRAVRGFIRHDSDKLASAIRTIIEK